MLRGQWVIYFCLGGDEKNLGQTLAFSLGAWVKMSTLIFMVENTALWEYSAKFMDR